MPSKNVTAKSLKTETVTLPFCPHAGQLQVHDSDASVRVVVTGRQWGKTLFGANEFLRMLVDAGEGSVGCISAPTYWHLMKCWNEVLGALGTYYKRFVVGVRRAEHSIELIGKRTIYLRSAEEPSSVRSQHWACAWLDEVQLMPEELWFSLSPALFGRALLTGTPFGHNWVYRMYVRGQEPEEVKSGRFQSWCFPTSSNPFYPKAQIDEARRTMPELWFRQEFLGEFVEDVGSVFRNVSDHIYAGGLLGCSPGGEYVIGVDLAKAEDFTVLVALDLEGRVCGFERFHGLDWVFQRGRVADFCQRFNGGRLLVDSTGLGDPVLDELHRIGVYASGYKFSNSSKANLVENLSRMMDDGKISYPQLPELLNELRVYGYELSEGGGGIKKYGAPSGFHDDCCMALALAAWQLRSSGGKWDISFTERPSLIVRQVL